MKRGQEQGRLNHFHLQVRVAFQPPDADHVANLRVYVVIVMSYLPTAMTAVGFGARGRAVAIGTVNSVIGTTMVVPVTRI
jgi:hypothetical protein